jgi:hypothetical protein
MNITLETGYQHFEELIAQLRSDGHTNTADKLDYMMHRVAWTTGRELIGEFGEALLEFEPTTPSLSSESRRLLSQCMDFVRQTHPDIK